MEIQTESRIYEQKIDIANRYNRHSVISKHCGQMYQWIICVPILSVHVMTGEGGDKRNTLIKR